MPVSVCWLLCYADRTICNSSYWIWSENCCRWGMAVFPFLLLIQVSSLVHRWVLMLAQERKELSVKQSRLTPSQGQGLGAPSLVISAQHKARVWQYDVVLAPRSADLSLYCKETYPLELLCISPFFSAQFTCPGNFSFLLWPIPCFPVVHSLPV